MDVLLSCSANAPAGGGDGVGGLGGAAEGATPCAPTGGFAVAIGAAVGVGDVAVVEALPLGFPGAKVTKLGSMSGRLPLAL